MAVSFLNHAVREAQTMLQYYHISFMEKEEEELFTCEKCLKFLNCYL